MLPQFFDIHSHVNDKKFDEDRDSVFARMVEHKIGGIIVGTDSQSSQDVVEIAMRPESEVYASIGIHPIDIPNEKFNETLFEELLKSQRVVAVGECGLDYSRISDGTEIENEKERQKKLFKQQVDFAVKHSLPLMIHVRDSDKEHADAHKDILKILSDKKEEAGDALCGNVHFFSQTIDVAREYFALGFTISFTGVITFSDEYNEVIRKAPLDRIMSETDSPYVAPVPYRGKRNEPIYVEEVVKKIAEIRGEDFETVRVALAQNALRTFNIKEI